MRKIAAIDIARSLAILTVLAGHLGLILPQQILPVPWNWIWYKAWVNGSYGVPLFFVISGFLITRLIAVGKKGLFEPDFREFYARRVGRIFPLLTLTCVIGLVFHFFIPFQPAVKPNFFGMPEQLNHWDFWAALAFFWFNWYRMFHAVSGFQWMVLWSLSVEEQFYFFYPLALKKLRTPRNLAIFLCLFIALGPVSQWAGYSLRLNHYWIHYNSFNGFSQIALGALLYLASERFHNYLSARHGLCVCLCVTGLAWMAKIYFHQPYFADYWGNLFDDLSIGGGLFVFLLGALHLNAFDFKAWAPVRLIGQMSYGAYLYQSVVIFLLYSLLSVINPFFAFFTAVTAVTGISVLSFHFFEKPANLFLRRLLHGASKA